MLRSLTPAQVTRKQHYQPRTQRYPGRSPGRMDESCAPVRAAEPGQVALYTAASIRLSANTKAEDKRQQRAVQKAHIFQDFLLEQAVFPIRTTALPVVHIGGINCPGRKRNSSGNIEVFEVARSLP